MTTQEPLDFDAEASARARDEAIENVQKPNPNKIAQEAYQAALDALKRARVQAFTTERVRHAAQRYGLPEEHEPRVIGAVMRQAAGRGEIEQTGRWVKSTLKQAHRRPIPVWRVTE